MKLVKRHFIGQLNHLWSEIDHKAFLSKNMFNLANYHPAPIFLFQSKEIKF